MSGASIATETDVDDGDELEIVVGTDGETLPTQEVVTGRGFITGKSGSGKSNSVNVVLEELLEVGLPALVVDSEGEYWPLKEEYDVLHLGDSAECDGPVTDENARRVAHMALEEGVPIVMDVSEFDDERANDVIESVVRALFAKAQRVKRPYLLVVEEIHEYLPQKGKDDLSELLTKVAKRGRKHGLGLLGASQRPSSVDKDYITQANWTVWHRLTYETDTKKVGKNLGKEYVEPVSSLDDGEAFLQGDWNDRVSTFRFRQKLTTDAGATPDVAPYVQTPIAHDTDSLLDELETTSESDDGDDGGDASECSGGCECAQLATRADALETTVTDRDLALLQKTRRIGTVRAELEETRQKLNGVRGAVTKKDERIESLEERLSVALGEKREVHSVPKNEHQETVREIVQERFGMCPDDVYAEYRDRVDDPYTDRTVRNYLKNLRDVGEVVFSGHKRDRRYFPAPDADLPDHVTPADAVEAVDAADTLLDVQRELRISRDHARTIVGGFDVDLERPARKAFARCGGENPQNASERVTVRLTPAMVEAVDAAVGEERFKSRTDAVRTGLKSVVDPEPYIPETIPQ